MSDEPSYEVARDELVRIVQRLETGGATLEESMHLWERGEKLADTCQRLLDGARARVDQARQQGSAPTGPDPTSDPARTPQG